jgi:proteasome assembly chaperone (PAC2) family protein
MAISLTDLSGLTYPIVALVGVIAGYFIFRSTYAKEASILKDDLINTRGQKIVDLEADIKALKKRDDEQQVIIDSLSKELGTWKNVPIKQLAEDYHRLAKAYTGMANLLKAMQETKK